MHDRTAALIVAATCLSMVHLHHGTAHDGEQQASNARRQWVVSGPQLTINKYSDRDLTIPSSPSSARSHSFTIDFAGKQLRKHTHSVHRIGHRYRRRRKSRKDHNKRRLQTPSNVDSVEEMGRQLRQYQARRIADDIVRLRAIHANLDKRRRRRFRRRCPACRRRRHRGGRRTTPKSTSLP